MLKDKDIICFSTIDWHFLRQRHQILMEMFAARGNKVIFVEHLGFSRQRLKDLPQVGARFVKGFFRRLRRNESGTRNIVIITPLVLPPVNPLYNWLNRMLFARVLAQRIQKQLRGAPIIWTYLATSTALMLIDRLSPSLVVYDCVYDAREHHEAPPDIAATEDALLRRADIVFADARYFYEQKKQVHRNVHQILPGVDIERFQDPGKIPGEIEACFTGLPRPRICFFGSEGRNRNAPADESELVPTVRVDLKVLEDIARQRPEWSVIFIGPIVDMDFPRSLKDYPHFRWLGPQPHARLPAFLAQCDVFILPYKINKFTRSIMPAKLFECLATGKPTVATDMPELAPYRDVITIAPDKEAFVAAIEDALAHDDDRKRKRRIEVAKNNTWGKRFADICGIIDTRLGA